MEKKKQNLVSMVYILALLSSFSSLFVFTYFLNEALGYNPDLYHVVNRLYHHPSIWLVILLVITIPMMGELAWKNARYMLRPSFTQILREKHHLKQREITEKMRRLRKEVTAASAGHSPEASALLELEVTDAELMSHGLVPESEYRKRWLGRKARSTRHNFEKATVHAMRELEQELDRNGGGVDAVRGTPPDASVTLDTRGLRLLRSGPDSLEEEKASSLLPRSSSPSVQEEEQERGLGGKKASRKWWWAPTWTSFGGASLGARGEDEKEADHQARQLAKQEQERRGVIRAMLRFRNLTGSQFTSAAQARLQEHDPITDGPKIPETGPEAIEMS